MAGHYLNRAALIPTYEQSVQSIELVERERERLKGVLTIDMVVPDYYAKRPKPCMGGWGKGFMNITPAGKVLPCHAAETIPGLQFDNVQDRPLLDIWLNMVEFHNMSACPPARLPADPTDIKAMLNVLLKAEQCAVRGYNKICDMTIGKDHRTYDLALAILHEEIEHEAWFSEFLGHGPSGHYSREGRPNSPYVGKFLTAGQG